MGCFLTLLWGGNFGKNKIIPSKGEPATDELRDKLFQLEAMLRGETGETVSAFVSNVNDHYRLCDAFQSVAYDAWVQFEVVCASTLLKADLMPLQELQAKADQLARHPAPFFKRSIDSSTFLQSVQDCGRTGSVPPALEKAAPAARMYRNSLGVK